MSFASLAEELRNGPSSGTLAALPYAAYLGLHYAVHGRELVLSMPFAESLVGQPFPPRLHGGTVAGLLEITATATLLLRLPRDEPLLTPLAARLVGYSEAEIAAGEHLPAARSGEGLAAGICVRE